MADLFTRIKAALAGTYVVEREIGRGGMAQVFLARDMRHDRLVAVKVFLPEVAEGLGTGRFLREIKTAANLSDPHILPLFDSGDNDGLLYYMMPFVDGMSLAERIAAEGQLPIDDALTITRSVALALQHAHSRGFVHRDIKPGNILLADSNVFVADFGIAHALEETGADKLTSTGFAVGTPAYMSPEQSGGYGQIDGRADIYSLGCVLYEMLVGEPPFSGKSTHAILARHSVERVPSVRAVRDTVPWAVEQAIHKALAKTPADRFATAEDFAKAIAPDRITAPIPVYRPNRRWWAVAAASVVAVGLIALAWKAPWKSAPPPSPAAGSEPLVAVMPLHVGEAADDGLRRRAGEIDEMLALRFPGEGGPRAVFPGTVAAAVARAGLGSGRALSEGAAAEITREVGARLSFLGEVGSAGDRLSLSGALRDAYTGEIVGRASEISGPLDNLPSLLDRLVATILVDAHRQPPGDRADLIRRPLPALRAFLSALGEVARGKFDLAVMKLAEAYQRDTTFLRAAVGMATIGQFVHDSVVDRNINLVRPRSGELSPIDKLYFEAVAGTHPPLRPGIPERLAAWEFAVLTDTSRVEGWYQLGEALFHDGPFTGTSDVLQRAANAFRRVLRIEPGFIPALGHLLDLAANEGDSAEVRSLSARYFAIDSIGELADYYRWRSAVALGDQRELVRVRGRIDGMSRAALERMVNVSQLDGAALGDGARAAEALWSRGGLRNETRWGFTKLREIALNAGRPAEAAAITTRRLQSIPLRPRDHLGEIIDALIWDADTVLAARLVQEQGTATDARLLRRPAATDSTYYFACGVNLWRLSRGQFAGVERSSEIMRQMWRSADPLQTGYVRVCADILDAQLAAARGQPDAPRKLESLDSIARSAPPAITWVIAAANLTAARLWEQSGNLPRALVATRRRLYITDIGDLRVLAAYSTFLREEGRLAALTGDRAGAITAYRKYLALRADAEPSVLPEVERVRGSLDSLQKLP